MVAPRRALRKPPPRGTSRAWARVRALVARCRRASRKTEVVPTAAPERRLVTAPDVVGQSSRAAREAIAAAGPRVGEIRHGFDGDRDPYIVLRQTPAAGASVEPGTAVEVVINAE